MILTPDNEFAAILDASVLSRMATCELLMRCCEEPALFRMLWADRTLDELHSILLAKGYSQEQADFRLRKMREAFPEASVSAPESLVIRCPEITDNTRRYVFAAAVREGAHVIVTCNKDAFPKLLAEEFSLYVQTPDEFLVHQTHLNFDRMQDALDAQASTQRVTRSKLLERLSQHLPKFCSTLNEL